MDGTSRLLYHDTVVATNAEESQQEWQSKQEPCSQLLTRVVSPTLKEKFSCFLLFRWILETQHSFGDRDASSATVTAYFVQILADCIAAPFLGSRRLP